MPRPVRCVSSQADPGLLGVRPIAFLGAELGKGFERADVIGIGVQGGLQRRFCRFLLPHLEQGAAAGHLDGDALFGIGLASAIFLDATGVRMVLVLAVM